MRIALLAVLATLLVVPATASADDPQPPRDIANLDYAWEGHFKAGDPVPTHDRCQEDLLPETSGKKFNPSGKYNAFDNNVFEVLCLPFRAAGDESAEDPYGNAPEGNPENLAHGYCSPNPEPRPGDGAPLSSLAGECPNHQLEYVEYYEETMRDILGDFGVTMHRYEFENPGSGNTLAGRAINPAAVVPGADHPEETVIIGAHFDQTTEGPASAWDSAEGHAQIIRVAKIMADYWRATGTRPSATVKFIPWDAEESGTVGSLDYTENNIVPEEEEKVRGYFNTDPCAGGYPAYRYGNPNDRVALGIQLARIAEIPYQFDKSRVQAFNDAATGIVEEVFEKLDDTVPTTAGPREVFISTAEGGGDGDIGNGVTIGSSRPVLFSSDWANFLAKGVPFFNPGPEVTGPSDESEPNNPDGLAILHTPNDNIITLNKYTGDATGEQFSEGWMKGMEMCAQLLSWGMLRGDQGGAQTTNEDVVAYYEALPNEARARRPVNFDAAGSYRYSDDAARTKVDESQLSYSWDFGDGSTGTGKQLEHTYRDPGVYTSVLTVTDTATGQTDTMSIPITVLGGDLPAPVMGDIPELDADGNFELRWAYDLTQFEAFANYEVEEAPDFRTLLDDDAEDLPAGWEASEPDQPDIQPWQHSDEAGDSLLGDQKHNGERSFWTGINRQDQKPGPLTGLNYGASMLTLKSPIRLGEDAELTYRSLFVNDLRDKGRVEVAVDDGDLDWKIVDSEFMTVDHDFCTVNFDCAFVPTDFEQRRVDLGRFANQTVRVRFVYQLLSAFYLNVYRAGWYVDDMRIDTGTFRNIGNPTTETLPVSDRTLGTYSYRVRAQHEAATSQYSLPETVRVGAPPRGSGTGSPETATQPPPGLPGSTRCRLVNGFRSARVRPRGRGLRFAFRRATRSPVRVEVFRQSRGRRIMRNRRVAFFPNRERSFTWKARRLAPGAYYVRLTIGVRGGRDARRFAVVRRNGRFVLRRTFYRRPSCGVLQRFRLGRTVFGGRRNAPLVASYRLASSARVSAVIRRGNRVVRRIRAATRVPGRVHRIRLRPAGLARGEYTIRLTVVAGNTRVVSTLGARRL